MWWFTETTRPPAYETVLIYPGECRKVAMGFLADRGRWFDMEGDEDVPMTEPPTHWMPLPDPPK